jgi:glycine C-acetyltransferase
MATLADRVAEHLATYHAERKYRPQDILESEQGGRVRINGREAIMLASNNYLGLASHPKIKEAAIRAIEQYGAGTAGVRYLCGNMTLHHELEERLADWLGFEACLVLTSCFAANQGVIPAVVREGDLILSDELNHASIIDGVRLARATKKIYRHCDAEDLDRQLAENPTDGLKMVITDGVFSMEGDAAPLDRLLEVAQRHGAFLLVDDSHATGFVGPTGKGTPEQYGVEGKVEILTSTMGKALGGIAGGFICGSRDLRDYLTQAARTYIFTNALPPAVLGASIAALDLVQSSTELRDRLYANTRQFREQMAQVGYKIPEGDHPICPVIVGETPKALDLAKGLFEEGVFATGFGFPLVPEGQARVRAQISAAHTERDIAEAVAAFEKVGKRLGII